MKIAALVMLFAAVAFAQAAPAAFPAACGPEKVSFKVTRDQSQHSLAEQY